jgi:DNA-binding NarL/FixJ family response regulator
MTLLDGQPRRLASAEPMTATALDLSPTQVAVRLAILDRDPLVRAGLRSLLQTDPRSVVVGDFDSVLQVGGPAMRSCPDVLIVGADQLGERFRIDYNQSPVMRERLPPLISVMVADDSGALHAAITCTVRGYVDRATVQDDLTQAIAVVRSGRTYLSPTIAATVIELIASRMRQERLPSPEIKRVLTQRELQVLIALGKGMTNTAIAHQLRISGATVRSHTYHILSKLGLATRTEAVLVGHTYSSSIARP